MTRAEDHAIVHDVIVRDLVVRLLLVALEHIEPVAALHLRAHLLEIKAIRAVGIVVAVALRHLVVVGDENRARHAPVGDVGFGAGLGLALGVVRPVRLEMLCKQKVRRQRMEVAFAHQHDAGRKRRHHGADDFRPRLLERLCQDADAEFERGGAREADLETVVGEIDVVGRIALPDRQDDVDRFGENLVAVLVEYADRLANRR